MRNKPTFSTKPVVVLRDGREAYLVTKGEEQSLLYLIEEQREQHYPNELFEHKQQRMRMRLKRRRKRTPLNGGGAGQ